MKDAIRLSFIMSIPTVMGAEIILPLLKEGFSPGTSELIGIAVAGLVGFFTIDFLLRLAAKINFWKVCTLLGLCAIILGLTTLL
jgi:undecaprenyl pyrophosphate phosphatase UppP